jgi:hypothetical protein
MLDESNRRRARKARFDAAHAKGMASLRAHDYDGFADAVEQERAIIDEESAEIAAQKRVRAVSRSGSGRKR